MDARIYSEGILIRNLTDPQTAAFAAALRLRAPQAAELDALSREGDAELRALGLLHLADRMVAARRPDAAAALYQSLLQQDDIPEIQARARRRLEALSGRGGLGQKCEFFIEHLAQHSLDPLALATMTLGGATYRIARLGALSSGAPRAAAAVFAWGAEVSTFTLAGRLGARWLGREIPSSPGHDLASAALVLGSLRLSAWAGGSLFRRVGAPSTGPGPFPAISTKILPLAVPFAGITLGHGLEQSLGLREAQGAAGVLADSFTTLFHFQVAGRLAHRILGKDFSLWERRMDLRAERMGAGLPPVPPRLQAVAEGFVAGPPMAEAPAALRHYSLSRRHGSESPPPQTRLEALRERFLPLFPKAEWVSRAEEIVQAVGRIPCDLPDFHERLLEALVRAPRPGSREQLYLVLAIEDVFGSDAVRSATGSFDYALLQRLLGRAVSESDGPYRNQVLQAIFGGMEGGRSREHWLRLSEGLGEGGEPNLFAEPLYTEGFWRTHGDLAGAAWANYRPQDHVALFNFAYRNSAGLNRQAERIIRTFGTGREDPRYPAAQIDRALEIAREMPQGELVLQRLHDIFAVQDSPAKLFELSRAPGSNPKLSQILHRLHQGRTRESLAFEINGSSHTAYLHDVRLARKVLAVMEDVAPYLHDPALREANKARLVKAFETWAAESRDLAAGDLFRFLEINSSPVTEALMLAWMARKFDVELVPAAEFDRRVAAWGKTRDCDLSIFFPHGGERGGPLILIKAPELDLGNEAGRKRAFAELMNRVKALAHEAEHWRHVTGNFFGTERGSRPLRLAEANREERYVSEIMAYLEEFRWRARNLDADFWEISRRLGETLPVYLRGMADRSYFAASNQARALR